MWISNGFESLGAGARFEPEADDRCLIQLGTSQEK